MNNVRKEVSPAEVRRLAELIELRASLAFNPVRLERLGRFAAERAAGRGLDGSAYFDLVSRDRAELNALLGGVTTKETYFFRLPHQFEALAGRVLPEIEDELGRRGEQALAAGRGFGGWDLSVRAWSAGCATGEEAWSLAMALIGGLRFPRAWKIELLATDVSARAVAAAERGIYPREAVARVPEKFRRFVEDRGEFAVMGPAVRRVTRFGTQNLGEIGPATEAISVAAAEGPPEVIPLLGRFDLIFCRNVMIYFGLEAQQRLIDGLFRALAPGGWLFTGDAELLNIHRHCFERVEGLGACIYRKPREGR